MTEKTPIAAVGGGHPIVLLACTVIVIAGAKLAAPVLVPFLLSLFVAIVLLAPLKALTRRGFSHWLSVLIVMAAALFFFASVFMIVGNASTRFAADLPGYKAEFQNLITHAAAWFDARGIDVTESGLKNALEPERLIGFRS